jgi:hypothetical protein
MSRMIAQIQVAIQHRRLTQQQVLARQHDLATLVENLQRFPTEPLNLGCGALLRVILCAQLAKHAPRFALRFMGRLLSFQAPLFPALTPLVLVEGESPKVAGFMDRKTFHDGPLIYRFSIPGIPPIRPIIF